MSVSSRHHASSGTLSNSQSSGKCKIENFHQRPTSPRLSCLAPSLLSLSYRAVNDNMCHKDQAHDATRPTTQICTNSLNDVHFLPLPNFHDFVPFVCIWWTPSSPPSADVICACPLIFKWKIVNRQRERVRERERESERESFDFLRSRGRKKAG